MIPLRLTISGIYSYREKQEIDFQALTAAHLFGIFGPVGSGKSAILEAIIYALFGEAERLGTKVAYNLMNLRSNELFIQFDFRAAGEEGAYRAVVRSKRNNRKFEEVKPVRSLYRIEGDGLIPLEVKRIDQILGISYENFRRTIIIPQGKFQEFLQLNSTARSDMLKELFNLQKFDLSFKTSRLQKKNDEILNNCQGRLLQLGEISEEEINQRELELKILSEQLTAIRIQLREKSSAEAEMQRICVLYSDLARNHDTLTTLKLRQDEIHQARQRLVDYEECVDNFKTDFTLLRDKEKQRASDQSALVQKQFELDQAQVQLAEAEARFRQSRIEFETRETVLQQSRELEICARVNSFRKSAAEIASRIETGETKVKETSRNLESLKSLASEFSGLLETLKGQLPDIFLLQKANDWYAFEHSLQEKIAAIREKKNILAREINSGNEKLSAFSRQNELYLSVIEPDFSLLPEKLTAKKQEIEVSLQEIQNSLLHLELQNKLRSFASALEEGKPCPLCGSSDHPQVILIQDVEDNLNKLKLQKTNAEKTLDSVRESLINTVMLLGMLAMKEKELSENSALLTEAENNLVNHGKNFAWPGLNREKLQEEWDKYSSLQKEMEKLDLQVKEYNKKAESEALNEKKFTALLSDLIKEKNSAEQRADELIKQLLLVDYSRFEPITADALNVESGRLKKRYAAIGEEYTNADNLLKTVSSNVQRLAATVNMMMQSLGILGKSIDGLKQQLDIRILSSRFHSEEEIRNILSREVDRIKEQQRIQQYQENLASVTSAVQELEKQLDGKIYEAENHERLKTEIAEVEKRQQELDQKMGALKEEVIRMHKALADSLSLRAELKKLEIRRENIKTITDLFRGQGFVNFVSTIYLQNLVINANGRFCKLTRQQLKLELDDENNFRIRDYLNDGEWRSIKTLSGGQTFQAALCLALALADSVQQLNQNGQNFFFLDEGFGSLDRESLEMVFDTLKSLRKENRIVGVISHVEDLQQEITSWLRVSRDDEHGSLIRTSWD